MEAPLCGQQQRRIPQNPRLKASDGPGRYLPPFSKALARGTGRQDIVGPYHCARARRRLARHFRTGDRTRAISTTCIDRVVPLCEVLTRFWSTVFPVAPGETRFRVWRARKRPEMPSSPIDPADISPSPTPSPKSALRTKSQRAGRLSGKSRFILNCVRLLPRATTARTENRESDRAG